MGHFMAAMGFMEGRGTGWLIMCREMRAFNGTDPELVHAERDRFVRVTFRLDGKTRTAAPGKRPRGRTPHRCLR